MSVSRTMIEKVPRLLLPMSPSTSINTTTHGYIIQSPTTDSEKKKRNVNSLYDNLYSPRTEITDAISSRLSDNGDVNSPSRERSTHDSSSSSSSDKINHIPRTNSLIEFIHRTGSIDEYQHGFLDSPVGSPRSCRGSPRNVMSRSSRAHNCPHLAAPSPTPIVFSVPINESLYGSSSGMGMSSGSSMIDASQLEASLQKASLSLLQTSMDELDVEDDDEGSIPAWDQWNDVDDRREYRESFSSSPRFSFDGHPSESSGDDSPALLTSQFSLIGRK